MHQTKPFTHVLWLQRWEGGKFREWCQAGRGYIERDENGNVTAYNYQHMTTIGGWNGHTVLLPVGVRPKDPEVKPQRPARPSDAEEEDI